MQHLDIVLLSFVADVYLPSIQFKTKNVDIFWFKQLLQLLFVLKYKNELNDFFIIFFPGQV